MSYYFSTNLEKDFDAVIDEVISELGKEGFGVLTEIDVQATMKKKLGKDMPKYRILGACNPPFAYKAFSAEDKIGTMLPCNVIVRETENGKVEVAAVDPVSSMQAVQNRELEPIAGEVREKLKNVVAAL